MLQHIVDAIESRDVGSMVDLLLSLGENAQQVRRFAQSQNVGMLTELLSRHKRKLAAEDVSVAVEIVATVDSIIAESATDADGYPEEYPHVLQYKLVFARQLVREKQRLSNSLWPLCQANDQQGLIETVKLIQIKAKEIDKIYQYKLLFDKNGILHEDLLSGQDKLPSTRARLEQELKNANARISKARAKLKNPKTYVEASGQNLIRIKNGLQKDEELRAEIKQKLRTTI